MSSNYMDVKRIQKKFEFPVRKEPQLLDEAEQSFREKFLQEELNEFIVAHNESNLEDCADALIDIVVVAMGTAIWMGLPWQKLWDEVQRANMDKVAGPSARFGKDLRKPNGWLKPQLRKILGLANPKCGCVELPSGEMVNVGSWRANCPQHRRYEP